MIGPSIDDQKQTITINAAKLVEIPRGNQTAPQVYKIHNDRTKQYTLRLEQSQQVESINERGKTKQQGLAVHDLHKIINQLYLSFKENEFDVSSQSQYERKPAVSRLLLDKILELNTHAAVFNKTRIKSTNEVAVIPRELNVRWTHSPLAELGGLLYITDQRIYF